MDIQRLFFQAADGGLKRAERREQFRSNLGALRQSFSIRNEVCALARPRFAEKHELTRMDAFRHAEARAASALMTIDQQIADLKAKLAQPL